MNGIYDFDCYPTPHLDVEMLMKRKAQKRARRILILSGIAAMLMGILTIILFWMIASVSQKLFVVSLIAFSVYIVIGVVLLGRFIKKGEYLWQAQVH